MELVKRLTEQEVTPGTLETAFSTRALQAAQLMPVTLYCSIDFSPFQGDGAVPVDFSNGDGVFDSFSVPVGIF